MTTNHVVGGSTPSRCTKFLLQPWVVMSMNNFELSSTYKKILCNFIRLYKYESLAALVAISLFSLGLGAIFSSDFKNLSKLYKILLALCVSGYVTGHIIYNLNTDYRELAKNYLTTKTLFLQKSFQFFIVMTLSILVTATPLIFIEKLSVRDYSLVFLVSLMCSLVFSLYLVIQPQKKRSQDSRVTVFPQTTGVVSKHKVLLSFWLTHLLRKERAKALYLALLIGAIYFMSFYIPRDQEGIFHVIFLILCPFLILSSSLEINTQDYIPINNYMIDRSAIFLVDTLVWGFVLLGHIIFYFCVLSLKKFSCVNGFYLLLMPMALIYFQYLKFIFLKQKFFRMIFFSVSVMLPILIPIFLWTSTRRLINGRL